MPAASLQSARSNQIVIVINLVCEQAHPFEGWFRSSNEFKAQKEQGLVSCPVCGSHNVVRKPSAPYLNSGARPPSVIPSTTGHRHGALPAGNSSRPRDLAGQCKGTEIRRGRSQAEHLAARPRRNLRGRPLAELEATRRGRSAYCRFRPPNPLHAGPQASGGALHESAGLPRSGTNTGLRSLRSRQRRPADRLSNKPIQRFMLPLHSTSKPQLDAQARNALSMAIVVEARKLQSFRYPDAEHLPRFLGSSVQ